ncbi:hypothetical protein C8F04DRAFT_1199464 [Mycena alexandri]|uniref:Uncharacterized protein n=1 Tax=Mycena alexandri TaxID=1745969 RepID=A0AAD6S385_9AGAR|nr:hypothetical protein C8F04DRAFT_1199464 [Mycena alexandri]
MTIVASVSQAEAMLATEQIRASYNALAVPARSNRRRSCPSNVPRFPALAREPAIARAHRSGACLPRHAHYIWSILVATFSANPTKEAPTRRIRRSSASEATQGREIDVDHTPPVFSTLPTFGRFVLTSPLPFHPAPLDHAPSFRSPGSRVAGCTTPSAQSQEVDGQEPPPVSTLSSHQRERPMSTASSGAFSLSHLISADVHSRLLTSLLRSAVCLMSAAVIEEDFVVDVSPDFTGGEAVRFVARDTGSAFEAVIVGRVCAIHQGATGFLTLELGVPLFAGIQMEDIFRSQVQTLRDALHASQSALDPSVLISRLHSWVLGPPSLTSGVETARIIVEVSPRSIIERVTPQKALSSEWFRTGAVSPPPSSVTLSSDGDIEEGSTVFTVDDLVAVQCSLHSRDVPVALPSGHSSFARVYLIVAQRVEIIV